MSFKKLFLSTLIVIIGLKQIHSQEFPIHVIEEGQIIVQVTLNDSISVNFILDTGAGINVLSGKIYEKIKTTTYESGFITGFRHDGDRLDGKLYTIPSIAIGSQKVMNSETCVFPPLDAMGIDGLLSLKFFENKLFAIDYASNKLIFFNENDFKETIKNKTKIPIELINHGDRILDMMIPITLNENTKLYALFDTGSGHNTIILHPYYLEKLKLKSEILNESSYKKMISGEQKRQWITEINTLKLTGSDKIVNQPTILFKEDLIYEGLIGSRLFADGKIFFDIENKTLYID